MKRLKIILLFSFIVFLILNIQFKSKYNIDDNEIIGIINKYRFDDKKVSLEVIGREKVICNYYFKNNDEKSYYIQNIKLGQKVYLNGTFKSPNENTNFNLFNYKNYLLSKKIFYIFNIDSIKIDNKINILYKFKNFLIKRLDNLDSPYLYTFILGDNYYIDSNIKSTYQNNGISHLLAISGMHITFLFSSLYNLLEKIKKSNINIYIVGILLFVYLFLVGFSASSVRAGLLFIVLKTKYKNIKSYYILCFILLLLLIYNPYYIYNIGFLLSFIVTFYILIFKDLICGNYIKKLFMTSLIAFIAGMPIIIYNYNSINLLSVFLNILFVPFITYIIFPLSFISLLTGYVDIYNFFTMILEKMSVFFNNIAINIILKDIGFLIVIYFFIGIFVLIKMKKGKYKFLFIYLICFFIHSNLFNIYPVITMLDVGQGDSILIEFPFNRGNILIDTGGNDSYSIIKNITIPYLKKRGIKSIEYLIISHGDYDHMGEAINLVNNFKVDNVIFNCGEYNDLEKELIKVLGKKKIPYYSCIKKLNINNNKLHFLQTRVYDNENDNSNVIYTELGGYKFMFMGDAGVEVEKNLIEKYNLENIDVLKVGHHGSKTSSSKSFIDEINPKYSIISVGKNNRYGHPNDSVLDNLKESKIYRTDKDGSIMFKIKNNKLKIDTCSP